jgi:hypothetical protein
VGFRVRGVAAGSGWAEGGEGRLMGRAAGIVDVVSFAAGVSFGV